MGNLILASYMIEQRTKITEFYFENQQSIILTRRAYCHRFNIKVLAFESMIRRLVAYFQQQKPVADLSRTNR